MGTNTLPQRRYAYSSNQFFALTPQPAGIYHRFAVDDTKFFHVMRLFQGEPVWTPHNRALKETEKMRAREEYITKFLTARS